jgi:hypothetical protein
MRSIFVNKSELPSIDNLQIALGDTFEIWKNIEAIAFENYPKAKANWFFSSQKFGWSYRVKDSKRVIIYLLPRDNFFKIAFIFGQNATEKIFESNVSENIKSALKEAKVYAEGRGIRIDVRDRSNFHDIQELIKIKIMN